MCNPWAEARLASFLHARVTGDSDLVDQEAAKNWRRSMQVRQSLPKD